MYKRYYWYRSSVTRTMREGLKDIFKESLKFVKLNKNDVILDIGANDGTLLKYYKNENYNTIGCEPAKNLRKDLKRNCKYMINDSLQDEQWIQLFTNSKKKDDLADAYLQGMYVLNIIK